MPNGTVTTAPTCRFAVKGEAGEFLCQCMQVTEQTVRTAVDLGLARTLEEVMAATQAGTGCRACHCRIQRVLNGLPAKCGGRFDWCHHCGCINAICSCEAA